MGSSLFLNFKKRIGVILFACVISNMEIIVIFGAARYNVVRHYIRSNGENRKTKEGKHT